MASPAHHRSTLRQLLRRIYPHRVMGYARAHFRHPALGPVSLAGAVELLESVALSLVPREAQGIVHYILGLNTELCQAGPVAKDYPARQARPLWPKRRASKAWHAAHQ